MTPLNQALSPFSFRINEFQYLRPVSIKINRVQIEIRLILEFVYLNADSNF